MHFSTSDEDFQKKLPYGCKEKFLNSIPLEFLKSIHSPQTRLKKPDDFIAGFVSNMKSLKAQQEKCTNNKCCDLI